VYEVEHLISRRHEAMKILLPDQSASPEMVERFRREVQTLAALNHPNIAALHTAFYNESQLAMVMELIQGETLRERNAGGSMPLMQALDFIAQTLRALVYAHRAGVVHRDIKPSNIMIANDGVVKLLDFGIALTDRPSGLTRAGYLMGSLNYMSPEQVNGGKAAAQSDLYSVGVTLYELVTGKLPITGETTYQIMLNHVHKLPVPPHEIAPHVPLALSAAILRALEKDPERRFASAEEFLQAIHLAGGGRAMDTAATMPMPAPTASMTTPAGTPGLTAGSISGGTVSIASMGQKSPPGTPGQKPSSGSGLESLPLQELSRKLAVYIGPVAKFVVKKLAAQHSDIDTIYREAAKQIPSDSDRAAFLRSKNT
jgi:serine/threonine-protein kinase